MKRGFALLAATATIVVGGAAGASAGEVNGNGDPTPVQEYRAGSICSFSGLNDDPDDPRPFEGGRVQSFGDIVQEFVDITDDKGASSFTDLIRAEGPGTSCRGYASEKG